MLAWMDENRKWMKVNENEWKNECKMNEKKLQNYSPRLGTVIFEAFSSRKRDSRRYTTKEKKISKKKKKKFPKKNFQKKKYRSCLA